MKAETRRRLSMAVRVTEFSKAQPSDDPGYIAVVARLEADVDRADQLIVQERDGRVDEKVAHATRAGLRTTIERLLSHLVRVAATAAKSRPELKEKFKLFERRSPNRVLLGAAESLFAAATIEKEILLATGLGVTFLDQLSQAINAYDAATGAAHSGKIYHIGARADLIAVMSDCVALVSILDGFNRARFAGDAEKLAAWKSAKNVAGPFRSKPDAPQVGQAA
jgi:hypothetical protein